MRQLLSLLGFGWLPNTRGSACLGSSYSLHVPRRNHCSPIRRTLDQTVAGVWVLATSAMGCPAVRGSSGGAGGIRTRVRNSSVSIVQKSAQWGPSAVICVSPHRPSATTMCGLSRRLSHLRAIFKVIFDQGRKQPIQFLLTDLHPRAFGLTRCWCTARTAPTSRADTLCSNATVKGFCRHDFLL